MPQMQRNNMYTKTAFSIHVFLMCIGIAVFLCTCVTEKKCSEKYPAKEFTVLDTVVSYQTVHDTIFIPKISVSFDTLLQIPQNIIVHHSEKKNGLTGRIDISKGIVSIKCTEDSLRSVIEHKDRIISTFQTKVEQIPCNLPHKTKWDTVYKYDFWIEKIILLLLAIIAIIVKFK